MEPSHHSLAVLLAVAGLLGGTIEYAALVARRVMARRRSAVDPATLEASGLSGLVRVFIVGES